MQRLSCQFKRLAPIEGLSIANFQSQYFRPSRPVVLRNTVTPRIRAIDTWFDATGRLIVPHLAQYGAAPVPIEHTVASPTGDGTVAFEQHVVPLDLFLKWAEARHSHPDDRGPSLYLAQASLADLPAGLRDDLPVPELVREAGKGDVYDASLWLGFPPTVTPLHRDPNPNLLVQLAGAKRVRMLAPAVGAEAFREVKARLGRRGPARMRGAEMMGGEERRVAEEMIWGGEEGAAVLEGVEACLAPGDAVFIPLGWWHAVRGVGDKISASVNWWFR